MLFSSPDEGFHGYKNALNLDHRSFLASTHISNTSIDLHLVIMADTPNTPAKYSLAQIRTLMDRRANIRNMSVIAHGKPLLQNLDIMVIRLSNPVPLHSRSRKVYSLRLPGPACRYYLRCQGW